MRAMAFWPSHPVMRPIFCLSRSQTANLLFTVDVSLVPCPISHNPLPLFQEAMLIYCPPHLVYISSITTAPIVCLYLWPSFLDFFKINSFSLVCSTFTSFALYIYLHSFSQSMFTSSWTPFSTSTLFCQLNVIFCLISIYAYTSSIFTPSLYVNAGCGALRTESKEILHSISSAHLAHSPSSCFHPYISCGRRVAAFLWPLENT